MTKKRKGQIETVIVGVTGAVLAAVIVRALFSKPDPPRPLVDVSVGR